MILIYFFSDDLSQASFFNSETQQLVLRADIQTLSQLPKNSEVIVIVPAHDVLLTSVELPKMPQKRLQKALPFALEEKLLDDVDNLHFALGDYHQNHYQVAIVSKEKLNAWLAALKPFNLFPTVMLPATLLLPYSDDQRTILSDEKTATVRTGKFAGFGCDKNNLSTLLELHPAITINYFSEKDFLEKASTLLTENTFNLLQNEYVPTHKTLHQKKTWVLASYLALAWIGILFFSHIISFLILHHQNSKIEFAIEHIYQHNFPESHSMIAPKQRMEDKLKKLTEHANKNHLLLLLTKIGKALSQTQGVHLNNLDFRNGQLTLDISAATFDHLDQFSHQLTQQNLSVKQQNAGTTDTQIKATLLIGAT